MPHVLSLVKHNTCQGCTLRLVLEYLLCLISSYGKWSSKELCLHYVCKRLSST